LYVLHDVELPVLWLALVAADARTCDALAVQLDDLVVARGVPRRHLAGEPGEDVQLVEHQFGETRFLVCDFHKTGSISSVATANVQSRMYSCDTEIG
jgi:hypothetical protein